MRHRVAHRKLGRVTEHRLALLRNQAQALLRHERIHTTVAKAKELRPFVERLITVAKRGLANGGSDTTRVLNARRMVLRDLSDRAVVTKLFETIAPRFEARPGGYTRLLRIGRRPGDDAEVAQVELIGSEYDPSLEVSSEDGDEAIPSKDSGVGGRIRKAARRIRGDKEDGSRANRPDSGSTKAQPKRTRKKV